ncbi:MAG: phosphomannomutase/phosphoglucomutase [Syntrophorhabdaceae bacterium]|nr:phosphomannomutase/phosphoglucomutase [Syntrophorhabdaceae bacterium]
MNRGIFREYDIRGTVDRDLTDDVVRNIGRAVATYMKERGKGRASIGRDGRLSSLHFKNLILEGMVEGGLDVMDLGLVPTPLFYFSLFKLGSEGGVMVTGSHNPPEFNGFKVACGNTTLYGEEIQDLRRIIEDGRFVKGQGSFTEYKDVIEDYYQFLRQDIHIKRRFKVVIDAGNGVAGMVAVPFMKEINQEVIELFCDVDGRFPNHFPDPTVEKNIVTLKETVLKEHADVGIGFDGDGDRIGIIDNEGNVIWGDYLMIIFARDIFKSRPGGYFVSEVKCSRNLYEDIEKHGGKPIMWKAGHSLIKKKMKEINAVLGGEMSGHMFFADRFFGYDDAIYASLRFLEIMDKEERPVSEFLKDLPKLYSTPEIRVECPDEVKFNVVNELVSLYRDRFNIIDIDGVRVMLKDGWGLVRASNTQPVLVLRFEAETEEALKRIESMVREDLEKIMKRYVP